MRYINNYKLFNETKSNTEHIDKTRNMTVKSVDYDYSGDITRIEMDDSGEFVPSDDTGYYESYLQIYNDEHHFGEYDTSGDVTIKNTLLKKGDVISFEYGYEDLGEIYGVDHIIINGTRYPCSVKCYDNDETCLSYIISSESKIGPIVNWDILEDAKYLALEYLDEGCTLEFCIYHKKCVGFTTRVFKLKYSHDGIIQNWDDIKCLDDIKPEDIQYIIGMCKYNNISIIPHLKEISSNIVENLKLRYEDLSDRIKSQYEL